MLKTRRKPLVWVALLATAIYVLLVGGNSLLVRDLLARVVLQALAAGVLGTWLAVAVWRPSWRPTTPLLWPVLVAAASYGLSAALSQRPRLSLELAIGGIGWAIAYLLVSRLLERAWFRARISAALQLFVVVIAGAYLIQVVVEWARWWVLVGELTVPPLRPSWARLHFSSPNDVAAVLTLVGPLAAVLIGRRTGRSWIGLAVVAAVLLAVAASGSRGGYLGLAVAAMIAGILVVANWDAGGAAVARSALWRPAALLGAGVALAAAFVFVPALALRLAQSGDSIRFDLWRATLTIFVDYPMTGGGPGTWVQLKVLANPEGVPNNIFSGAHNDFVQAAAEIGVVGILAFGYLGFTVVRRLSIAASSGRRPIALEAAAVTAGLAGFAVQCLFENFALRPAMTMLVIVAIAWVDSSLQRSATHRIRQRPSTSAPANPSRATGALLPVAGVASVVLAAGVLTWSDAAAFEDVQGTQAMWEGDWAGAVEHFDAARSSDPGMSIYQLRAASARARLGRIDEARQILDQVVALDPVSVNVVGLAALQVAAGDDAAGLAGAHRAASLAAGSPTIALNAGLVAEATGNETLALQQFANAMAFDPPLAQAELWDDPGRIVTKRSVVDLAVARGDPLRGALILAYADRPAEAEAMLGTTGPSPTRETYAAALEWLAGDTESAVQRLHEQLRRNPLDWQAAGWLARITRLSGDPEQAGKYAAWALAVQFDRARTVILEASVVPAVDDAPTAGLPSAYPSAIYLRDTGAYLLMPQLVLIGYR